MSGEPKKTKNRVLDDRVLEFLAEFAEYLIAAGVSYPRLDNLVRTALYRAAASRAMLRNRRLNQSALATITGLTRVQVRQFARQSRLDVPEVRDRLTVVIHGWVSDAAFLTPRGTPKRLGATGNTSAFAALVRKYGGDVSARSVLRELERHGYVTCRNDLVTLKRSALQSREELRLVLVSRALLQLLKSPNTANASPMSNPKILSSEAVYPSTSEKSKAILNKRIAANLRAFLNAVEVMGEAASSDSPPRGERASRFTRTRVVLITEDFSC